MDCTIGCFSGFWGDSLLSAQQLLNGNGYNCINFLVGDYLAEVTMGILSRNRNNSSVGKGGAGSGGFITEFADRIFTPLWPLLEQKGTRIITNAGGMNPKGLRDYILQIAQKKGWKVNVVAVYGDDVTSQLPQWLQEGKVTPFSVAGVEEPIPPATSIR